MRRRGDRLNRVVLAIIALKLLALCVLGLLASYKVFGSSTAQQSLVTDATRDFVNRNRGWIWPSVVAAAIVIGFLSYKWFRLQFRAHSGQPYVEISTDRAVSSDRVSSASLAEMFSRDIEVRHHVSAAVSQMFVRGRRIDLEALITLDDLTHLSDFLDELRAGALSQLQQAIGREDIHVTLRIRFAPHAVAVS